MRIRFGNGDADYVDLPGAYGRVLGGGRGGVIAVFGTPPKVAAIAGLGHTHGKPATVGITARHRASKERRNGAAA